MAAHPRRDRSSAGPFGEPRQGVKNMRHLLISLLVLVLLTPLSAQQTGDANRNYSINNQGSGQASPSPVTVVNSILSNTMSNVYATSDPNAPLALIIASQGMVGWYATATNSVDIGPAGLTVLLDGLDGTNPTAPFLTTGPTGTYQIGFTVPQSALGTQGYFAMLHAAATSPDGFWLSQTHHVTFDPANNLYPSTYAAPPSSATTVTLGDDDSVLVDIGFSFEFYGNTYTQCYINSNGNITFGAGSTIYLESVSNLVTGPPRVAAWWDDLNPSAWGTVAFESTSTAFSSDFRVWWSNVPEFGSNGGGLNTFSARLHRSNIVAIGTQDYDVYVDLASLTSNDGMVGISPGQILFGTPSMQLDLSAGPHALSPTLTAYYEQFSLLSGTPSDVEGHQIHFDLEDDGYPSTQN